MARVGVMVVELGWEYKMHLGHGVWLIQEECLAAS